LFYELLTQALVSQLMANITGLSPQYQFSLQLASLGLLEVVIGVCQSRITNWTSLIVDGLARLWVNLESCNIVNKQGNKMLQAGYLILIDQHSTDVEFALRKVIHVLAAVCPSVVLVCQNCLAIARRNRRD
jgi:hypothetical protein